MLTHIFDAYARPWAMLIKQAIDHSQPLLPTPRCPVAGHDHPANVCLAVNAADPHFTGDGRKAYVCCACAKQAALYRITPAMRYGDPDFWSAWHLMTRSPKIGKLRSKVARFAVEAFLSPAQYDRAQGSGLLIVERVPAQEHSA